MSKIKSELATRCELALMGKVMTCTNEEVQSMTEYIFSAMGKDISECGDVLKDRIHKYNNTNNVKYIVCNTIYDMKCVSYLLESTAEDEEERYPAPFETDYGSGYPCAFCYVLNADVPEFSEFGDSFFAKRSDGCYHKVS